MSRTCWWIDRQLARSDDTVQQHCTCAEESPDFSVKLPAFMDFSPTDLPTTGIMTTPPSSSETPPDDTTSPIPTNATTLIAEATSTGWPLRTVSSVTLRAQEAAENSASTLKGATPQFYVTSKSLSTLSSATTVDRNATYVFLRTAKPSVSTDSDGFTSPQLHKDPTFSPGTESTVRPTTENFLEVADTGIRLNNINQTKPFVEEGKENEAKHGSGQSLGGNFAVDSTKRIPLNKKSHLPAHIGTSIPSYPTNTLLTNTITKSYPPNNTLESVTNTDSSNPITNDAVTTNTPQRKYHVSMGTKSSSNVNSRISSTTVKSSRRTAGRVTPLSSSVLYSSVSSLAVSSGGIHVSSRSTPAPHHPSSASPGLNASHGVGRDSRLMLIATTSSGAACILLLLFTLLIFIICRSRGKKRSSRDIDVIPVANEEGVSLQGTPTPGVLKRAGPGGNNNPTLTESQDNGIDGAANSSSNNSAAATNTVVTLTDISLKGDPV